MVKPVSLSIFVACGPNDSGSGIYQIGNDLFELRCFAGVVEFEPDLMALPLQVLLAKLETYGLRNVRVNTLTATCITS